ncbi:MAG: flagellar hook-length control protein FliK [Magnetococcus sp. WYHC-3]
MLFGRITALGTDGRGVIRLADGRGFAFMGGQGLMAGERIQVQVTRLTPELTFRLVASESGSANRLAQPLGRSLAGAPDLMGNLLSLVQPGSSPGGGIFGTSQSANPLLLSLQQGWSLQTASGQSLTSLVDDALPKFSANALLRGDVGQLLRLLEQGETTEVRRAVVQLRQAAADLRALRPQRGDLPRSPGVMGAEPDVAETVETGRALLRSLSDLLALQDILPRTPPAPDGTQLLGYRLFWLAEGGVGEAIWQQERQRQQGGGGAGGFFSVLLSLNMTRLGPVQARLALGENQLSVGLSAQEDAALHTLRTHVAELRQGLVDANLPLRSLELSRMSGADMRAVRGQTLALGSGFERQA